MGYISPTEIFANTFRNGSKWIHIFFPVALLVTVFSNFFMYQWAAGETAFLSDSFWLELATLLLVMLAMFAIELSIFDAVLERRSDWLAFSLKRAAWRMLPLLLALVLYYLIYLVGLVLLIIPGLMAVVLLSMMIPLVVLDGVGPFKAVQVSYDLVWGNAWLYVAASFLVVLPLMAVIIPAMFMPDVRAAVMPAVEPSPMDFSSWQVWIWLLLNSATTVYYMVFYLECFKALKTVREQERTVQAEASA